ncbi:type I glutamate--ammonia ligase [Geotoga petraea]|jgi:glutamine synthetase|uniref:Glutamine synthetase n=1 Tax=Geotoga petraea TaxID=28234 RepID=A0A1G6LNK9_9BACT|nr:type I glutamate--ammonia ligase [Geotoga petraea]MDK2946038.1 glutamine synthetase [Geotoga sp.]TGG87590.1 type I glutamate--ammonia ligase [Geotoga petraea]SDC44840.1 L-glutamine synthetase [Geotoga petraea]
MTKGELKDLVEKEGVKFVRLQVTDINGMLKNVEIPVARLEESLSEGTMFDGSSIEGFARIDESDMLLKPDMDTFTVLPWTVEKGKVARFICDILTPEGNHFEGDPRYVLKKVINQLNEYGYEGYCGPEPEFFLLPRDEKSNPVLELVDDGGYFDLLPIDLGEETRKYIVEAFGDMRINVEASHHEVAPSQHEIDFEYDKLLRTADNIQTFKLVVKTVALLRGLHATFMPKPFANINGSGMHTHLSLFNNGENIFYDKNAERELSDELKYFIGGIIKHIKAITAIANPTINSYKRLVPGFEAPTNIAWSVSNRSALIRVPSTRGKGTRAELRSPDPTANPYLLLAVVFASGLEGIKNKIVPEEPVIENIYKLNEKEKVHRGIDNLPDSLEKSILALKEDKFIQQVLGKHIIRSFIAIKEQEILEYKTQVTDWEIKKYLKYF